MKSVILSSFTATLLAIGLTACGESSSGSSSTKYKTKDASEREHVIIFYHYPKDICESPTFINSLGLGESARDAIAFSENRDVNCATYGKVENEESCWTEDYSFTSDAKSTCVIAMNRISSDDSMSKSTNDRLFMENIQEAVIRAF